VAAGGDGLAHRLVVVGLLAVVEGAVVERVHQVGLHLAEEHAHLRRRRRRREEGAHDKAWLSLRGGERSDEIVVSCDTTRPKLTLFQSSF
jgi:hypothetical protein